MTLDASGAGGRAVVLGAAGQLGREVADELRRRGIDALAADRRRADVTDTEAIVALAARFGAAAVYNCAACTDVDGCETDPEAALEINGRAPARLAAALPRTCRLIHVSTDYVFDGPRPEALPAKTMRQRPAPPTDARSSTPSRPWPTRADSSSARAGCSGPRAGTSSPRSPPASAAASRSASFPTRSVAQRTRPTSPALSSISRRAGAAGIVHYCNVPATSWHGFAIAIVGALGLNADVAQVATADLPRPAVRPAYSVLDVARFESITNRRVEEWAAGLDDYFERLGQGKAET